jgi:hypothetical protein|tara:strand:- start:8319 stop:10322 length:2004 start_codon:yes stop_codon:yes gene_type:complete
MALGDDNIRDVQAINIAAEGAKAALNAANKSANQLGEALAEAGKGISDLSKSANKFVSIQEEAKKSSKGTADAIKEQEKNQNLVKNLQAQALIFSKSTLKSDRDRAKILSDQADNAQALADSYGKVAEESSKLDKSTAFFSKASEVVKDIPGLRKFSGPFEAAAKASRQTVLSNAKLGKGVKKASVGVSGLKAGFKSLGKGGPMGVAALIAMEIFKAMVKGNVEVTKLGKNFSVSFDKASLLRDSLNQSKTSIDSVYATSTNLIEAFTALSKQSEFISASTNDQLQTQLQLTKQLGLSTDEATQLQGLFAVNNEQAEEGKDAVYDQVAAFKNQTGLLADSATIFKQIASTSKLTRLNFKGGTEELAKTVLNANRLGLTLTQVENIGGSLLDFESSIAAELEAELLTGRKLNLEKARTFALNNDIAGLTQEIAKQGITAEKFSGMNRIQQEAIAKSLGMQASELADSLYKQKLIDQTAGSQVRKLREEIRIAKQKNQLGKAAAIQRRLAGIEQGIIDGKSLEAATQAVDAQEKFNLLIERMKEIFTNLFDGDSLNGLINIFERLVYTIEGGRGALGLLFNGIKSQAEIERSNPKAKFSKEFEAQDFTIKTHPKDTLVMAGGTKLGGGSNSNDEVVSLLRELVNRNGDVYLDGQKVGNSLSSNYRTLSN